MAWPSRTKEKIILASIPVLGAVIVALISTGVFNFKHKPRPIVDTIMKAALISKAGKINDIIVYDRFDDLYPSLTPQLRSRITKPIFEHVQDSIRNQVGDFVKVLDTSDNNLSGVFYVYIKNQYQKGTTTNAILFDHDGKLFGIFCTDISKR